MKETVRTMSVDDIIDKLQCAKQGPIYLAICENSDGYYAIDEWFDAETLAQIICKGTFKDLSEADFIEGAYLCIWAQKEYSNISEAEAKICKNDDEVKEYIMQLIDEDVLDDVFEDDDFFEEEGEEDDYE